MRIRYILFLVWFFLSVEATKAQNQLSPYRENVINQKMVYPDYVNEEDPYMGRSQEFLNIMVLDKLPEDFPKYDKSYGLRYYNELIDVYFRMHPDVLKEKWKQKIMGDGKPH
ncbi:MAG: hypothetical protein JST67_07190 [Bacteroidetes bacterium]|nr:hypothetical protein [Bacteroidota bacterium]